MKRIRTYTAFLICVAAGGALGSAARLYLLSALTSSYAWMPTLIVNAAGALIIGFVYAHEQRVHHYAVTFAAIGFCGGFTTLSHFSYQTVELAQSGMALQAIANIGLSLLVTLIAAAVGIWIGRVIPFFGGRKV